MSWAKYVTLFCDGCPASKMTDKSRVSDARAEARDWKHTPDGRDLCPACSAGGDA